MQFPRLLFYLADPRMLAIFVYGRNGHVCARQKGLAFEPSPPTCQV